MRNCSAASLRQRASDDSFKFNIQSSRRSFGFGMIETSPIFEGSVGNILVEQSKCPLATVTPASAMAKDDEYRGKSLSINLGRKRRDLKSASVNERFGK